MLGKTKKHAFYTNCYECGEMIIREKDFGEFLKYKCDKCKKKSQWVYNRKAEAKKILEQPKSIWDTKLEHYKLTKSIYGRRSD